MGCKGSRVQIPALRLFEHFTRPFRPGFLLRSRSLAGVERVAPQVVPALSARHSTGPLAYRLLESQGLELALDMSESNRQLDPDKTPRSSREDTSDSGVDRTLIRWMLSLSPTERLDFVQRHVNAVQQMREAADSE
jgi:hypothetical protein